MCQMSQMCGAARDEKLIWRLLFSTVGLSAEQLRWYKFILSYFSIQIKIILLEGSFEGERKKVQPRWAWKSEKNLSKKLKAL